MFQFEAQKKNKVKMDKCKGTPKSVGLLLWVKSKQTLKPTKA